MICLLVTRRWLLARTGSYRAKRAAKLMPDCFTLTLTNKDAIDHYKPSTSANHQRANDQSALFATIDAQVEESAWHEV